MPLSVMTRSTVTPSVAKYATVRGVGTWRSSGRSRRARSRRRPCVRCRRPQRGRYSCPAGVAGWVGPVTGAAAVCGQAGTVEAVQSLDVDVDDLAGMSSAVAVRRFGWLKARQPVQAEACEHRGRPSMRPCRALKRSGSRSNAAVGASRSTLRSSVAVRPGGDCVRRGRSGWSRCRRRRSGQATGSRVRSDTPAASAASSTLQRSSRTRRHISFARPRRYSFALPCN